MFPADPLAVCSGPRSLCVVPRRGDGLIRDAELALELRHTGLKVHLLCPESAVPKTLRDGLRRTGVSFASAATTSSSLQIANILEQHAADASDRLRLALEQLHAEHSLDMVVFPVSQGQAFRAIQARRCGLGFNKVRLAVWLDDTGVEQRQRAGTWPTLGDLECDHLERRAFELADVRLVPERARLEKVQARGWHAPAETQVQACTTQDPVRWLANQCRQALDLPATCKSVSGTPLVTVCVPHYNLGEHLPAALASLAAQTYQPLEVIVIDDGSTDGASRACFAQMQKQYPAFRFLEQTNAGIGATRNRGLAEARGELFIPFDADNLALPDMVERFVVGMQHRPDLAALSCYFLAFENDTSLQAGTFLYACRPTGGPHVVSCLKNLYGDACAVYRTEAFRAVGGYETDRNTSFEDWEAFVKLVHGGKAVDVLPAVLFYYRHLETGFSRRTDPFANQQRVVRQYRLLERLPECEREMLWSALIGLHGQVVKLEAERRHLRYRLVDRAVSLCRGIARIFGLGA